MRAVSSTAALDVDELFWLLPLVVVVVRLFLLRKAWWSRRGWQRHFAPDVLKESALLSGVRILPNRLIVKRHPSTVDVKALNDK